MCLIFGCPHVTSKRINIRNHHTRCIVAQLPGDAGSSTPEECTERGPRNKYVALHRDSLPATLKMQKNSSASSYRATMPFPVKTVVARVRRVSIVSQGAVPISEQNGPKQIKSRERMVHHLQN